MERTNQLTQHTLNELLNPHGPPCISLYQPTSRHMPEITGDPIRYKNLLKRAEASLQKAACQPRQIDQILEPLRALQDAPEFWNHQLDALALFRSADFMRVLKLPREVSELLVVADTFHTKPLIRILQTAGRYHVLCVSQRNVSLYEGARHQIDEIPTPDVPHSVGEASQFDISGARAVRIPQATSALRGQPGDPDERQGAMPLERYFRIIDILVTDHYSRSAGLPMILAAVEQYHDAFQKVSKNPNLLAEGIKINPDSVPAERLREEAWRIIEPYYHERTRKLIDDFHVAKARQAAAEDVRQVAEAAAGGRVAAVLVDASKHVGGRVDPATGAVELKDSRAPDANDVLDDTAEFVLRTGGQVMVIPPELMPTDTGIAAIYRY